MLSDPFSLLAISEDESQESLEDTHDHPFKLARWLLLNYAIDLQYLTFGHTAYVMEKLFSSYFVISNASNRGLAAERRIGRKLSDRWNANAAQSLCVDLGQIGARSMRFGEASAEMHRLCVRLSDYEEEWVEVYLDPRRIMYDECVAQSVAGVSHEFSGMVRASWQASLPSWFF